MHNDRCAFYYKSICQTNNSVNLWSAVIQKTEQALQSGALIPIATRATIIADQGIGFVIHLATNLRRKAADKQVQQKKSTKTGKEFNPFLPPEPGLTVADIGSTHVAVLNKFNVVDHHLLIVTRQFEHQQNLLTIADFQALWQCMQEYDSLGFYNGGNVAGASQTHKHLQLIPLSLNGQRRSLPIENIIQANQQSTPRPVETTLPFQHRLIFLDNKQMQNTTAAASVCYEHYLQLLIELEIKGSIDKKGKACQSAPYNLLMTKHWMLMVPRTREHYQGISINAMGFAGSLFVRDEQELALIKNAGPVAILQKVSGSDDTSI